MRAFLLLLACLAASVNANADDAYYPIIEHDEHELEHELEHVRHELQESEIIDDSEKNFVEEIKHFASNTQNYFTMNRPKTEEEIKLSNSKLVEEVEHDFSLQTELTHEETLLHMKGEGKRENKNPKVTKKDRKANLSMKPITEAEVAKMDGLSVTTTFKLDQTVKACDALKIGDLVDLNVLGYVDETSPVGNKFDIFLDTRNSEAPFSFIIGEEEIIEGFEKGVIGMCRGEKRTIIVEPNLAYGESASGDIPAGSILHFDVEILHKWDNDLSLEQEEARETLLAPNIFAKIDTNKDAFISKDEYLFYFQSKLTKDSLDEYFKMEDTDGDIKISWGEFTGPKGCKFY
jgi:FKBP-type peptidyl-prolyl cis-trans isomerase